jgi:hypothetical protein
MDKTLRGKWTKFEKEKWTKLEEENGQNFKRKMDKT